MAWRQCGDFKPSSQQTSANAALLRGCWVAVVSAEEMLMMLKGEDQLLLAIQGGSQ